MRETFKDFTVNVKKSIDREYDGESNMEPNFKDDQKVLDDNVISSIEDSYENDYEDYNIVIDEGDDVSIEPERDNLDMIRLTKVKSINELNKELDYIKDTGIPAIIDLKYIQERRKNEFSKLSSTLNAFKTATKGNVVLLGSTKNVIVVTTEDVRIIKQ